MEKEIFYKLYICLGNIGKEYQDTRHNAGFLFGKAYREYLKGIGCHEENRENKNYSLVIIKEKHIIFLFPKTLMNLSGRAVKEFLSYTNIVTKLIVVHDDLDILLGDYKINMSKGPKNHNGISSIEDFLQTSAFERIRIGIENRNNLSISGLDYVLYKFTTEELVKLKEVFTKIIKEIF